MALVSLKNRVARLDAKHRMESGKVVGIIGGTPEPYVEDVSGVLYLRFPETPTGEPFEVVALRQQRTLQDELAALSLTEASKTKPQAPHNVGNEIARLEPVVTY